MQIETPSLSSLEGLTDIGLRGGLNMRPTLLRVLTDLYVQKLTHTADEEHHYTELALRLLDSVDVQTRAAVAARLARHLTPPPRVLQRLSADLPEVIAALGPDALPPAPVPSATAAAPAIGAHGEPSREQAEEEGSHRKNKPADAPNKIEFDLATELNELFLGAAADERRLILLNLDIVAPLATARVAVAHDPGVGLRLEAAALARKREDFAQVLAQALRISREQGRRIARDNLGEPIVVAAKALGVSREVLYRILLFVNTAIGHSVERVHALANLHDEITVQAAQDLVAIWQAVNLGDGNTVAAERHPADAGDGSDTRSIAAARRGPALPQPQRRREAS